MFFECCNAQEIIKKNNKEIELVMLMDVLEHIGNDYHFIKELNQNIRKDAIYIISVPTPQYPSVLGWRYHLNVGHVRRGYSIESLNRLMKSINKKMIFHCYNTGKLGSIGAKEFYNISYKLGIPESVAFCISFPFLAFDKSCENGISLFAIFE